MKLHGREIKVGSRVWHTRYGWLAVNKISGNAFYPIVVEGQGYTSGGLFITSDASPSLFWNELTFNPADIEPPKPMEIWVNVYPGCLGAHKEEGTARAMLNEDDGTTKKFIEVME